MVPRNLVGVDDAIALGRMIRESRLKQGMSLSQLASEVGRSSSSVRRWERGEVPPAKSLMPQLAEILDVDQAELDALRPGSPSTEPDPTGDGGPSTIEQPAVEPDPAPIVESEPEPTPAAPSPGLVEELTAMWRSITQDWTGWIRGVATFVVLIVMLIVLVWAAGQLFAALGEVWDSFDAGSS